MDDLELSEIEREMLRRLAKRKIPPICPRCGYREQHSRSKNGWCRTCDEDRERMLEQKREWWRRNRGVQS